MKKIWQKEGLIKKRPFIIWRVFLLNDPVYWQLGGPDESGKDQTSPFHS